MLSFLKFICLADGFWDLWKDVNLDSVILLYLLNMHIYTLFLILSLWSFSFLFPSILYRMLSLPLLVAIPAASSAETAALERGKYMGEA